MRPLRGMANLQTQKLMLTVASNFSVSGMNLGLLKVKPDQVKQLDIASEISCPECNSRAVYRTKRSGLLERIILYPLGYRAYQCQYCGHRFRSRVKPVVSTRTPP